MTHALDKLNSDGLSERMARFVDEYVSVAGKNAAAAAIRAGYSPKGASVCAHRLLHNDKVLLAIRREVERRFKVGAVLALDTLEDLCRSGPPAQKLGAAQAILAHAAFIVPKFSEHTVNVSVHHELSTQELREKIARLSAELGIAVPPLALTAPPGPVIDAEVSEVEPVPSTDEEPAPAEPERELEEWETP